MTAVILTEPRSLREQKKAATRKSIFETAIRLFSERGFDAPTIDEIAAAAGTGKGTVYNYFSSKEEILVAFMIEVEGRVQKRIAHFSEADAPLDRILCDLLRYQFRVKHPYLAFARVFLSELIRNAAALQGPIERMQEAIDPPLRAFFCRLQERNLIDSSVDITKAAHSFKCIHFGLSCLWAMEGPPFKDAFRALEEQVRDFARRLDKK